MLNSPRQKLIDLRIKDRNRKANNIEQSTPLDFSTPRIHRHCEKLKVKIDFKYARSKRSKISKVKSVVSNAIGILSPKSKLQVLDSSLTPNTKSNFAANVSSDGVAMELFRDLAPCLTRSAQRLQCRCSYHTNIDYVRKVCNNLLIINGKGNLLATNDDLMLVALCD